MTHETPRPIRNIHALFLLDYICHLPIFGGRARQLHDILDSYGIANSGAHTSAVAGRFQNHALPFFSKNLCASANCKRTPIERSGEESCLVPIALLMERPGRVISSSP
jgi:hypothetical protein